MLRISVCWGLYFRIQVLAVVGLFQNRGIGECKKALSLGFEFCMFFGGKGTR